MASRASVFSLNGYVEEETRLGTGPQWDSGVEAQGAPSPASPLPSSLPLQIHSDSDEGDGAIKYTISGEGAGTIFLIDELTGDIHAMERLDREQKTFYTLRAQARDRVTNRLLEPESEFIIKVQDINDSEPRFLHGPYIGSVAELSPTGGLRAPGGQVGPEGAADTQGRDRRHRNCRPRAEGTDGGPATPTQTPA